MNDTSCEWIDCEWYKLWMNWLWMIQVSLGPVPRWSICYVASTLGHTVECAESLCTIDMLQHSRVHLPERVMRQYGMVQGILPPCDTEIELHLTSRKGQGRRAGVRSTGDIFRLVIIAWSCLPKVRRSMQLAQLPL